MHRFVYVNRQKTIVKKKITFLKNYVASLFKFFEKVFAICKFFTSRCIDLRFWDLFYFICLKFSPQYSYRLLRRERDCIDLVVIFNKRREETFAMSLQNRKSYVCIKYSTLVRPRKLIAMNFTFFTRCKIHITPVSLKYYFKKKVFHSKNVYVMFMFTPYAIKRYI